MRIINITVYKRKNGRKIVEITYANGMVLAYLDGELINKM